MLARNKPTLFTESRSERVQMKSLEWFEIWEVFNERLKKIRWIFSFQASISTQWQSQWQWKLSPLLTVSASAECLPRAATASSPAQSRVTDSRLLKTVQGCELSSLSGQPVTLPDKLLKKKKKLVRLNRIFCILTCAHCPDVRHLNLCPSLPPFPIFTLVYKILLSLTFCSHSSLSLFSCQRCSCPFTTFMALCWTHSNMSMSFSYWGAKHWTQHSWCVSLCWLEGNDHIPWPSGNALPNAAPCQDGKGWDK